MLAVQGYYDGMAIRPLETITAKPNQKVIITVMDEFVDSSASKSKKGIRGILSQYADPALSAKEEGAWERAVVDKYGNV